MVRVGACLAIAAGIAALSSAAAEARSRFQVSSGFNYSSGDYGEAMETEVISVPLSARLRTGDWTFRAWIPYLEITGPADVVVIADEGRIGGGEAPSSGEGAGPHQSTERGFGDLSLSATRAFNRIGGTRFYADVIARVRLPTGDEDKGLGVGALDGALSTEIGYDLRGAGIYALAGRRFNGDPDDGPVRRDVWQAGIGGWKRLNRSTSIGAFADWREASTTRGEDPAEIGAYGAYRINDNLRVSLTAYAGLSDASPDYGVGIGVTWRFDEITPRGDR